MPRRQNGRQTRPNYFLARGNCLDGRKNERQQMRGVAASAAELLMATAETKGDWVKQLLHVYGPLFAIEMGEEDINWPITSTPPS